MLELKEELKKVNADENTIREIECNCDMVIFFAGILADEEGNYKIEAEKLIFEYETLWDMKNKSVGKDKFAIVVRKTLEKINK